MSSNFTKSYLLKTELSVALYCITSHEKKGYYAKDTVAPFVDFKSSHSHNKEKAEIGEQIEYKFGHWCPIVVEDGLGERGGDGRGGGYR